MHTQRKVIRPLAAVLIATALTVPAVAQTTGGAPAVPPGSWMIGARVVDAYPNVSSSLPGFDVKDRF
jgi:hypothetical protein